MAQTNLVGVIQTLLLLAFLACFSSGVAADDPGIRIVGSHIAKQSKKECEGSQTFAIFGAGGETGQTVVDYLLQQKHRVRIVTRNAEAWKDVTDVQVKAVTNYDDEDQFAKAFAHCDGAFISPHLPYKAEDFFVESNRSMKALRAGLARANVPKLVMISSIGAHLDPLKVEVGSTATSYWMEQTFNDFPAPVTFLRAAWILDNYKSLAIAVATKQGVLPSFILPLDKKREMVSNFDMGVWSAKTLLEKWDGVRALEVQGPSKLSPQDVAESVGAALKKRGLKAVGVPDKHYKDLLRSFLGPSALEQWIKTIHAYNSGLIQFEGGASRTVLGQTQHNEIIATWFEDSDNSAQDTTTTTSPKKND